ncbi:MAG: hypothetical protein KDF65_16815 [Anaerolineae bacterium]|nr:hypothetical protein [Anaerolineae bacterium]
MDKKQKKKAQLKKNRHDQQIFEAMRLRDLEAERVEEMELARTRKPSDDEKKEDPLWSEKVSKIRNRLTGNKRTSKERWNRFAGTEGGGGRGL